MLKPKPVSDEPPDIEPLVTRTLAAATLIATMALIFVCVAVPAGATREDESQVAGSLRQRHDRIVQSCGYFDSTHEGCRLRLLDAVNRT